MQTVWCTSPVRFFCFGKKKKKGRAPNLVTLRSAEKKSQAKRYASQRTTAHYCEAFFFLPSFFLSHASSIILYLSHARRIPFECSNTARWSKLCVSMRAFACLGVPIMLFLFCKDDLFLYFFPIRTEKSLFFFLVDPLPEREILFVLFFVCTLRVCFSCRLLGRF